MKAMKHLPDIASLGVCLAVLIFAVACGGDGSAPSAPTTPTVTVTPPPAPPAPPPAPAEQRFSAGSDLPGFPSGTDAIGSIVGGGSISLSGGNVTITLRRNAYVEYTDYRFTCLTSECRIENGRLTAGQVARTASGTPASGTTPGGTTGETPSGNTGGSSFGAGDGIPGFPQGANAIGSIVGGGSISVSGGNVTITLRRDAYVEYTDYRYTCVASECRIENGVVTAGRIERTAVGTSATGGSSNPVTSDAVEFVEDSATCDLSGPEGVLVAVCSGRVRAKRAVRSVQVTVTLTGLDGDEKVLELGPSLLGDLGAGQTAEFRLEGTFSTTATRFRISFAWEARLPSSMAGSATTTPRVEKTPAH